MRRIPSASYSDFTKKEVAKAIDLKTFSGMRDSGPDPAIEGQQQLFSQKSLRWVGLIANIGLFQDTLPGMSRMACLARTTLTGTSHAPSPAQSKAKQGGWQKKRTRKTRPEHVDLSIFHACKLWTMLDNNDD